LDKTRAGTLAAFYRNRLIEDTVAFWQRHGVDREHGGFFTCLDRDGSIYSTDKPVWFIGRATWLFATLYTEIERRETWLDLARSGFAFLERHCYAPSGKLYFLVTRTGEPLRMRRYVYSEVFAVMAGVALYRATGEVEYLHRAQNVFDRLAHAVTTPGAIEGKVNPRTRPQKGLSPLMCLVNTAELMRGIDEPARYDRIVDAAIAEIFRDFFKPEEGALMEAVAPDGAILDTPEGRCLCPGHAIETAWFIMDIGKRRQDRELITRSARLLDVSWERGWDKQYGGLLYFVDLRGRPSPHLEHDMKLWWPQTEAMIALALAWQQTGDARYAQKLELIHDWAHAHFADPEFGEWFGYLHRDGTPATMLKGGIWKGPFHLPRAQLLCGKLLAETADSTSA